MDKPKQILIPAIILILIATLVAYFVLVNKKVGDDGGGGDTITNTDETINTGSSMVFYEDYDGMHNGVPIDELLTKSHFDEVGIDPTTYERFEDFLEELKNYDQIDFDPVQDNFVIDISESDDSMKYVKFDLRNNPDNFLNKENKDLAILDIYKAYTNGKIYGGSRTNSPSKITFAGDIRHPLSNITDGIYNREININEVINEFEEVDFLGKENEELLSYMYDFLGRYDDANTLRAKTCGEYECENDYINAKFHGYVLDSDDDPVAGAKVELLNDTEIFTTTDDNGYYEMELDMSRFSYLRFKAVLDGYSDGYKEININEYGFDEMSIKIEDFHIHEVQHVFTINPSNELEYDFLGFYEIDDGISRYLIPKDGLYYDDGTEYTGGDFRIYTFNFGKDTNTDSLLESDTFGPVAGYLGNMMKTFGMPYILFFDNATDEELFIHSSNPMILTNRMMHMQELYDNYDQIYGPVTKEDMDYLYKYSMEHDGYPIDFDFLTQNDFLRWPGWWVLDRKRGVWDDIGQKVIDPEGIVELPFYSIKTD